MPKAIPNARTPYSPAPAAAPRRRSEAQREHQRFINSRVWRRTSKAFLAENPLCADCLKLGIYTEAKHSHHLVKPADNPELAFDWENLLALCIPCHAARTARGE